MSHETGTYLQLAQKVLPELPQLGHVRLDEDAAVEEPAPRVQLPPVNSQRADQPHCLRPVNSWSFVIRGVLSHFQYRGGSKRAPQVW